MQPYLLAIELPASIKSRLASLCYGLPQMRWIEESDFHLALRYLGPLSSNDLAHVKECLNGLFFPPFSLTLQGVGHFHSKKDRGSIWIGIQSTSHIFQLKKEIDKLLKDIPKHSNFLPYHPHIVIGHYTHLNPQKLGEYLTNYSPYQSEPFEVASCTLLHTRSTSKRIFHEVIARYVASEPATGED